MRGFFDNRPLVFKKEQRLKLKILITGVTGQIGSRLAEKLGERHEIIAAVRDRTGFKGRYKTVLLDLSDPNSTKKAVELSAPDQIIHCAAITSPESCEKNKKLCQKVNAVGTAAIASAAVETGSRLIYLSTDLVFDGKKRFYNENDKPNPLSYYGFSKLEGEKAVSGTMRNYLIARTAIVFGKGLYRPEGGFADWLIKNLTEKNRLNLFTDQFRSHFYLGDCVRAIELLVESREKGLFHISGGNRESRYDFAIKLAEKLGLDRRLITATKMAGIPSVAKRPKDCSLDNSLLSKATGFVPLQIEEGLEAMKMEL